MSVELTARATAAAVQEQAGPHLLPDERAQLGAALHWFETEVAGPVLAAKTPHAARTILREKAVTAAQARALMLNAINPALARVAPSDASVLDLRAMFEPYLDDAGLGAMALADAIDREHHITVAAFRFNQAHPDLRTNMAFQEACTSIVPIASDADILTMIVIYALVDGHFAVDSEVLTALCEDAASAASTHLAAIESLLGRFDPSFAQIGGGDWTTAREAIQFGQDELVALANFASEPGTPHPGLVRAAKHWR